jgi:thiol-disulfide isomerase/thioredoxin
MEILNRLLMAIGLSLLGLGLYWGWNRWQLRRLNRGRTAGIPGLETLRPGVPAILYFTTPDCVPCRTAQRPALGRLQAELGEGLQVVEVDASAQFALADYWGVLSAPTTFIIDSAGQPRRVNHGVTNAEKLKQQIEEVEGRSEKEGARSKKEEERRKGAQIPSPNYQSE